MKGTSYQVDVVKDGLNVKRHMLQFVTVVVHATYPCDV
jgi:hypothetical protein